MDSITQIVLGAAVGEAILGKKVGNKAMLWGAIAGTIPDLDVFANLFTDVVHATEMHRGFSHSVIFSSLFAPIIGWVAFKLQKQPNATWKQWSWMMFGSLVTHPLLDSHTAFGTQLFWPYELKLTYNNIFVVDPLYTIPFLIFLVLAMVHKRTDPKRRFYNNLGLYVSSAYMALTIVFKGIAHYHFSKSLKEQNIPYKELESKPTVFNSILWCGFVETSDDYLIGYYSLLDGSTPVRYTRFSKNHELLGKMADEDMVKRLIKLSRTWYLIEKEGDKIFFYDLRFGQIDMTNDPKSFVMYYELFYEGDVLKVVAGKKPTEGMGRRLADLWVRLKGV